jgi:ATP-binding cassette subfamily B protein/subfamily B ATP-binding cassette protein MsbA
VVAGGALVAMARLDPALAALAGGAAPAMAAIAMALGRPLRRASRARREAESALQAHVQQALSGIAVVQAFGQEPREHARFVELTGAAVRAQRSAAWLGSTSLLGTGLSSALGTAAVLLVGGRRALAGEVSVGTLLLFIAYLTALQGQLKAVTTAVLALRALRGQVDRAAEILEREPALRDRPGARPLRRPRGRVRVEGVTVGHRPGVPVLRGVSVEAEPGERIAIVGRSGGGKSTLAALLSRVVDPWEGRVTLDGHDLRDLRLGDVRRAVAVVQQEPLLLPATVAENLAYGRPGASAAEIEAAARAALAHEFIAGLPDGYATLLGEGGGGLSGGQRQRLAIARALLKDAPVLVLDEPTSALDPHTEALVLEALERLMADRTTFVVAHRLAAAVRADEIIVLEDGQVLERGRHEELLRRRGRYRDLWDLQAGEAPWRPAEAAR